MPWRADIALFSYALATVPETRAVSWPTLVKSLTTFRPAVEPEGLPQWGRLSEDNRAKLKAKPKLANPMWAPVQMAEGARRRLDSNVDAFSCLVLDFDNGTPVDEARAPWMNYPHVVHSSYSHTGDNPKYRIVIPLARPVPAATWPRVWHWADRQSGGQIDGQCKNPSRGYFVPVERGPWFSLVNDVADMLLVDPARLPPAPSETKKAPVQPKAGSQRPRIHGVDRQIEWALRNDPSARAAVARTLDATFLNNSPQSAKNMPCPKCGDRSAWFFVDIATMRSARCAHKERCGWHGSLTMLLNGDAGHE